MPEQPAPTFRRAGSHVPIIPSRFLTVRYVGAKHPGRATGLKDGANCQHFAYEWLRHFGFGLPPFRSSHLWEDRRYTRRVTDMRPLDLLMFGPTHRSWGAHVAVYIGNGRILHLCEEIGRPVVWASAQFKKRPHYRILIGIKRSKRRNRNPK